MTIIPIFKKCPVCGKKYVWNPDVGKIICPYCHGLGKPKKTKDKYILFFMGCDCYENFVFWFVQY